VPKERTHWHLAHRVASRLTSGALADAVLAYPEFVLAGAVSHDSAYYVLGDPGAKAVADRLHGAGSFDSFEPFRALAAHAPTLGAAGLAFGLGALTHLAADVTFHPLVFSWTGDEGAPDQALRVGWLYRHQVCETALDLHCEALWGPAPVRRYGDLVHKAGADLVPVVASFAGADPRPWIAAHSRLQGLFASRSAGALARVLAWGHRRGDGDWSGAFYPGRPTRHPAFEGTLEWTDPVTGTPGRASLEDLVTRFEDLSLGLAAEFEAHWMGGGVPFEGRVGPSLDTGRPGDQDQTKRFFSPKGF
jgi:hypothetical protein